MKNIILVRHGKSSWDGDFEDIDRPLKIRGINDANLVADKFAEHKQKLDIILSSPANRALSTCKLFINKLQLEYVELRVENSLYDFSGQNVINYIKSLSDSYNDVMIFGHNHAFTSIANIHGDSYIDNLPTSGLVKLNFDLSSWKDLNTGITEYTIFPRNLK